MTSCEYCGKVFSTFEPKGFEIVFCDKECLKEYCEEYLAQNWREHLLSIGVNFKE